MLPSVVTDRLGNQASITVDPKIYSIDVIFRTAYWFTDRFYVFLDRNSDDQIVIEVRTKDASAANLQDACAEFCNSLIDFRVREMVGKEMAPIREALVTKAFLEGISKPGLSGAVSNEQDLEKL